MQKLIFLLSVAAVGFAGFTAWEDPTVGPKIRAMLPDGVNLPTIRGGSIASNGGPDGTYGGIGAANGVAGAVVGTVRN